jgi:mevalonate kinase
MAVVGLGRGKLLLLGEHAAVYGHPAVGLSLDDAIRAELTLTGQDRWTIEGVNPEDEDTVREVMALYEEFLPELQRLGRGRLRLSATIQRGLGFGSSAALCVALSAALRDALSSAPPGQTERESQTRWAEGTWSLAHQAERLFHGTPSGIDTGLSLLNGLYAFKPRPPELPEARRLAGFRLDLVIGAVPRSTRAGALIGALRERVLAGDQVTRHRLELLGNLAAEGIALLGGGRPGCTEELGELCWRAGEVLGELGLATEELGRLLEEGRACGALGGKLSGAGGGGAFFLLFASRRGAEAGAQRLRETARAMGPATEASIRAFSWVPGPQ